MRICPMAPFTYHLHISIVEQFRCQPAAVVRALKRAIAANLVRNVQPGLTTPRFAVMLQLRFEKSLCAAKEAFHAGMDPVFCRQS
jgi:hypothetical protein